MIKERYSRFLPIDWVKRNFENLKDKKVLLIGAGALGSNIIDILIRGGIKNITVIDRDFVECSDLLTSPIYKEKDAQENIPKVYALKRNLEKIDKELNIETYFENFSSDFVKKFNFNNFNLIIDAVDNLETRFLINEVSFKGKIPWVHGACVSERGEVAFFKPWEGRCYRCLFPEIPKKGRLETCETHGINPVIAKIVASIQSDLIFKYLLNKKEYKGKIIYIDFSDNYSIKKFEIKRRENCALCVKEKFEFLDKKEEKLITFCSEKQVMLKLENFDMDEIEKKWRKEGVFSGNEYFISLRKENMEMRLFRDGKLFIKAEGINQKRVKSLISRYIGE